VAAVERYFFNADRLRENGGEFIGSYPIASTRKEAVKDVTPNEAKRMIQKTSID